MDPENVTAVELVEGVDPLSGGKLKSILEAILFAASKPISVKEFQSVLPGVGKRAIRRVLTELHVDYQETGRSFRLAEIANGYQVCTCPEYAEWVQKFYTRQVRVTLSPSALETLAIVAYKQPITRANVAAIRGVNSDSVLNSLVEKGLVRIAGRKAGRSLLFSTTDQFLQQFGLKDLTELPSLDEIGQLFVDTSNGDEVVPSPLPAAIEESKGQ